MKQEAKQLAPQWASAQNPTRALEAWALRRAGGRKGAEYYRALEIGGRALDRALEAYVPPSRADVRRAEADAALAVGESAIADFLHLSPKGKWVEDSARIEAALARGEEIEDDVPSIWIEDAEDAAALRAEQARVLRAYADANPLVGGDVEYAAQVLGVKNSQAAAEFWCGGDGMRGGRM